MKFRPSLSQGAGLVHPITMAIGHLYTRWLVGVGADALPAVWEKTPLKRKRKRKRKRERGKEWKRKMKEKDEDEDER